MKSTVSYLKNFARDKYVSSVTPTAPWCVSRILRHVAFDQVRVAVEYGPALGAFTRAILQRLGQHAQLIAIERNEDFARMLAEQTADPRLKVVADSAENVAEIVRRHSLDQADLVVSGIPFSFFSRELTHHILQSTWEALRDNGDFVIYQSFVQLKQGEEPLDKALSEYFELAPASVEALNLPPLRVYRARKRLALAQAANY